MFEERKNGSRLVDLSHVVEHGLITYRGLPAPVISDFLSRAESRKLYAAGTEFHIGKIEMVANTGTYLDAPFHRYSDGPDLSELPLAQLVDLDGVVIRAEGLRDCAVDSALFDGIDLADRAVLVHTGWDAHWGTENYFEGHPFLNDEVAELLGRARVRLVGIDSYNIDDVRDLARPVHSALLRAGIPIVEHLCNLQSLPDDAFKFFAVPVKVKGFGTFPVRAFAIV